MGGACRVIQRLPRRQRQRAVPGMNREQAAGVRRQAVTHCRLNDAAHDNLRRPARHLVARRCRFADSVGRRFGVLKPVRVAHGDLQISRPDCDFVGTRRIKPPCPLRRTASVDDIQVLRHRQRNGRHAPRRRQPDGCRHGRKTRFGAWPENQCQRAANAVGGLNLKIAAASPFFQRQRRDGRAVRAVLNAADANIGVNPENAGAYPFQVGQQARRQFRQRRRRQVKALKSAEIHQDIRRQ